MIQGILKRSLACRVLVITLLTLLLLIPAAMIHNLIRERKARQAEAVEEVSAKWGGRQTITGPVLSVPYKKEIMKEVTIPASQNSMEKVAIVPHVETGYVHFLPDKLAIEGTIDPEIRYRGIYEVALYQTQLRINADFITNNMKNPEFAEYQLLWDKAIVAVGITDMRGIKDIVNIKWNGTEYQADSAIETKDIVKSGISVHPSMPKENNPPCFEFSTVLNLKGSSSLQFIPVGKITEVNINSKWTNPSFTGNYLPESRKVNADGFKGSWKILHLNRNYPQCWRGDCYQVESSNFGVDLYMPVDQYQKTTRTAKYAIMFISLTFLSFFLMELLSKKIIHPIQYLLIGFGLIVFYTLLLSLSEHIAFAYAYLIASIAIILLIIIYTKSVLRNNRQTAMIGTVLILLYSYLYIVLQLQDYALLFGSSGLFIILAIVMYVTRNIDWFTVINTNQKNP